MRFILILVVLCLGVKLGGVIDSGKRRAMDYDYYKERTTSTSPTNEMDVQTPEEPQPRDHISPFPHIESDIPSQEDNTPHPHKRERPSGCEDAIPASEPKKSSGYKNIEESIGSESSKIPDKAEQGENQAQPEGNLEIDEGESPIEMVPKPVEEPKPSHFPGHMLANTTASTKATRMTGNEADPKKEESKGDKESKKKKVRLCLLKYKRVIVYAIVDVLLFFVGLTFLFFGYGLYMDAPDRPLNTTLSSPNTPLTGLDLTTIETGTTLGGGTTEDVSSTLLNTENQTATIGSNTTTDFTSSGTLYSSASSP